jgi:regulator of protease activity HflC (stomatin/prohibitin superfamily)
MLKLRESLVKKSVRRFGYVVAGPAEFLIHQRRGRTRKVGRGIHVFCFPLIDRCYLIPSSAQNIAFAADQITAENQGVEVAGFAVWKITDPEKSTACFNFSDSAAAMAAINENLRNVVESAIRHQVANMTIEDTLRKRGTIIVQLKNELAYIAGAWGLLIETIEIRNVKVLSSQLFSQMQAAFREKMRLESETSTLATEKQLAERRLAQKEEMALKEQEFARHDLERRCEAERIKILAEAQLQGLRLDQQRELLGREEGLHVAQAALETERQRHKAELAAIENESRRKQIETANMEDPKLLAVRQLPAALGALKVNELNLSEMSLHALLRGLKSALRHPVYGDSKQ